MDPKREKMQALFLLDGLQFQQQAKKVWGESCIDQSVHFDGLNSFVAHIEVKTGHSQEDIQKMFTVSLKQSQRDGLLGDIGTPPDLYDFFEK